MNFCGIFLYIIRQIAKLQWAERGGGIVLFRVPNSYNLQGCEGSGEGRGIL
jgi:hypothetical protein